jgi:hypothetical protein
MCPNPASKEPGERATGSLCGLLLPRIIRFRDAARYVGMDRNRFNSEVRPHLTEIPIGKQGIVLGRRVCQSTGTAQLEEAERYLARLMEATRQAHVYGVLPARTFEEAAAKFVLENRHKRSLDNDILQLRLLMPWIGREPMDRIHLGTLQPWIEHRRRQGKARGRSIMD